MKLNILPFPGLLLLVLIVDMNMVEGGTKSANAPCQSSTECTRGLECKQVLGAAPFSSNTCQDPRLREEETGAFPQFLRLLLNALGTVKQNYN